MKIIDFKTIENLQISPLKFYEWVEDIIKRKGQAVLPLKVSMAPNLEGVFLNCMACMLEYKNIAGVKFVSRYPDANPCINGEILLYNCKSGKLLALLDAIYITAMRTGAVAVHSIDLLAIKTFKTIAIIGLGNMARTTLLILLEKFNGRNFRIKLKTYKNQHISFMERFRNYCNVEFVCCDTIEETFKDSDVIISAVTVFKTDLIEDTSIFKSGCLLVPIHTRGFGNCDLEFDKIFADDEGHVKNFKYFNKFKFFSEITDVVNGNSAGRETDDERILVYNIGIAIHDINIAGEIEKLTNVIKTDLAQPKNKFWV